MAVSMKLKLFFTALVSLTPLGAAILPKGSELELRLLDRVGSRVSRDGDQVRAAIITPVFDRETILLPAGTIVSGTVERVDRLGLGIRHTAARLDLQFTQLHLSDGTMVPINARLASVEQAREGVSNSGTVIGIHPGASFSTGVAGVFMLFLIGEPEFRLPIICFKVLAARSPDAEITFPAGTEMLLRLTDDVQIYNSARYEPTVPLLTESETDQIQNMLTSLPKQRTKRDSRHESDLINIVLIGNQQAIERGFRAAGWTGNQPHNLMALYHTYEGAVERVGYSSAPMANLKFNGNPSDASFEKSLDTLAKRHHIRLWRDGESDLWLAAATEDVKYGVRALHLTHGTDPYIDNERAKVVNDLVFTGCVDRGALVSRPSLNTAWEDAQSILTDGAVAVLQLNSCDGSHLTSSDPPAARPRGINRLAVAAAKDLVRSNPVSVGYDIGKSIFGSSEERVQRPGAYTRPIAISSMSETAPARMVASR
jgi:LssY-like putative type I secretion system component LssY